MKWWHEEPDARPRTPFGADLGLAVLMLLLDGAFVILGALHLVGQLMSDGAEDDGRAVLPVAGLLLLFSVVSCAALAWRRAVLAAIVQGVAAVVFLGIAAMASADDDTAPAPTYSDYEDDYDGPGRACLSGGDNDECEGSSG